MEHTRLAVAFCAAAAVATLLVVPRGGAQDDSDQQNEMSKIRIGFAIMQASGIPLNLRGKNPALVGLGSYIVNAQSDCNGCHGNPGFAAGFDPFMGLPAKLAANGYLVGGNPLFGPLILPRNITPDGKGRPAEKTLQEFMTIMRTGKDLEHKPPFVPSDQNDLLQVMPWPVFRNMTDRDLRAVYEFLSSIPCLEGNEPGRCRP